MRKIKYAALAFFTMVMISNVLWASLSIDELRIFVVKFTALIAVTYAGTEFIEYIYEE